MKTKAQKKYQLEVDKQFKVINGAAILVLKEINKFGKRRINKILNASDHVWAEIAEEGSVHNIMEICEKETGIEMKLRGKSYKDEDVFQECWVGTTKTVTQMDYIYDGTRPWVANGFIASLLIGLHRSEKWGKRKRLLEFMENIDGVRGEWRGAYDYDYALDNNYDIQLILEG